MSLAKRKRPEIVAVQLTEREKEELRHAADQLGMALFGVVARRWAGEGPARASGADKLMLECFDPIGFKPAALALIKQAQTIIAGHWAQGFTLTLRQLFYQFVARGLLPNRHDEYKRLGRVIADARRAGRIDWSAIEDRTRNLRSLSAWSSPAEQIASCAASYCEDVWASQPRRPEVWIEKDALIGVIEGVCEEFRVPYFSCRGNVSDTEM
jgi:hypothetical protein